MADITGITRKQLKNIKEEFDAEIRKIKAEFIKKIEAVRKKIEKRKLDEIRKKIN